MSLTQLRNQIDKTDREILRLLNRRLQFATKIGETKRRTGHDIFDPAREMDLLERLQKLNKGKLPQEALTAIYREILSCSRAAQSDFTIAFVGRYGAPLHFAARELFGASCAFAPAASLAKAKAAVASGQCRYLASPRDLPAPWHRILSWEVASLAPGSFHLYKLDHPSPE